MTSAMLRPGASRKAVIEALVGHLTDASVPEFDFNFSTVYLLEERSDATAVVRLAAGAATASAIARLLVSNTAVLIVPSAKSVWRPAAAKASGKRSRAMR